MFHSIVIMSSWLVQLRVFTALFCVVYRREMLDTPVNMDNVSYSVTPAVTHLSYSRLDMVSIRNAMSPKDKQLPELLYELLRHNGFARRVQVVTGNLSGKGAAVLAEGLSGAVASGLGKVRYLN